MRILGIIPARYASTRFPAKPLIDINGKSMIQRVYEQGLQSTKLDELVVATDDERILVHIIGLGYRAILTSTEHQSGTDRCAEVAKKLPGFDVIVNIQGDEPLLKGAAPPWLKPDRSMARRAHACRTVHAPQPAIPLSTCGCGGNVTPADTLD